MLLPTQAETGLELSLDLIFVPFVGEGEMCQRVFMTGGQALQTLAKKPAALAGERELFGGER